MNIDWNWRGAAHGPPAWCRCVIAFGRSAQINRTPILGLHNLVKPSRFHSRSPREVLSVNAVLANCYRPTGSFDSFVATKSDKPFQSRCCETGVHKMWALKGSLRMTTIDSSDRSLVGGNADPTRNKELVDNANHRCLMITPLGDHRFATFWKSDPSGK